MTLCLRYVWLTILAAMVATGFSIRAGEAVAPEAKEEAAEAPAPAQAETAVPAATIGEACRAILTEPHAARGEMTEAIRALLDLATRYRDSGAGELALRMAEEMREPLFAQLPYDFEATDALAESPETRTVTRDLARAWRARAHLSRGEREEARLICNARGLVPHWLILGPLGHYRGADFYTPFPPETNLHDLEPVPFSFRKCYWRRLDESAALPAADPWEWVYPGEEVVYLLAQCQAETARKALLHIRTTSAAAAWWNGGELLLPDPFETECSETKVVPVALQKGWNRLLVKAYPLGKRRALEVRLTDREGVAIEPLAWEEADTLHPVVAAGNNDTESDTEAPSASTLPFLRKRVVPFRTGVHPSSPDFVWDRIALARESLLLGKGGEALAEAPSEEVLQATAPNNPLLLCQIALIELAADHLPPASRQNRARELYRRALKIDEACVPALVGMADLERDAGRVRECVDLCAKALEASPRCHEALEMRARLAVEQGWLQEAREWVAALADAYPTAESSFNLRGLLAARETDMVILAAVYGDAWTQDRSRPRVALRLAEVLARLDRMEESQSLLNEVLATPGLTQALLMEAADLLERIGDEEEALAVYERARNRVPANPVPWRRLGDLLYRAGKQDEALRAYRESLSRAPDQFDLRRLIQHLEGDDGHFWAPYAQEAEPELRRAELINPAGPTVRVIDQTVIRVYEDGSYANFTHALQKVLTTSGIEKAGTLPIWGEVLEARTIRADGQSREPLRLPGRREFTMPDLAPGAAVEFQYLQTASAPMDNALRFPSWYFRSPDTQEEFLLSQYIILVPEGYPFAYVARNLGEDVEFAHSLQDGLHTFSWTARDMPRAIHEDGSLHINETLPYIDIGAERTWDDINRLFLNIPLGRMIPYRNVYVESQTLVAGVRTDRERAERIYRFVCENVEHRPMGLPASRILAQRAGDRTVLLQAMLRAVDLKAYQVAARPSAAMEHAPDWSIPRATYFPIRLVGVELEDGPLYLDVRYDTLAAGEILEDLAGATAFWTGRDKGEFRSLPLPSPDAFARREERTLRFSASGEATAIDGVLSLSGIAGHVMTDIFRHGSEMARLRAFESELAEGLPGIQTESVTLPNPAGAGGSCRLLYTASSDTFEQRGGDGARFCPLGLSPLALLPDEDNDAAERETAYHLDHYVVGEDRFTFAPPRGAHWGALPKTSVFRAPEGLYELRFRRVGGTVEATRRYSFAPRRIALEDWPAFVGLVRRIEEAERQRLRWHLPDAAEAPSESGNGE